MRILLANKFFFHKGGAEAVFFQERDFLKNQGHTVIDFAMAHPDNLPSPYSSSFVPQVDYYQSSAGNPFIRFWDRSKTAFNFVHNHQAIVNITRLVQQQQPEIAHLHNIYHQITPSIIRVLKNHGVKVVLTLHDYKLLCPVYTLRNKEGICEKCQGNKFFNVIRNRCRGTSLSQHLLLALEAYYHQLLGSYDQVDLYVAPSRFMAEITSRYRIPAGKIVVLANGIDQETLEMSKGDKGYSLYFGRISPEKGILDLLQAQVQAGSKTLPLKIVGTGPLLPTLKNKFPHLDFLGFKSGRDLNDIIKGAAFVVVPSEWYENCSMSVLEAMAFGKPVIGAKIGGIPEQIEHMKTGLLFSKGNMAELSAYLTKLSQDPEMRRNMGQQGRRKLVEEYSLALHCRKLETIYRQVLAK